MGALVCCKWLLGTSTRISGISHGTWSTVRGICRHVALPGSCLGHVWWWAGKNHKSLLCGEFRELTRGWQRLTLQSYKLEVWLLLTAGTWSLPTDQPGYLRPWALTMGKPQPGVCKWALKWFDTKKATLSFESGRNVLLLQHQRQCCDFPTTNKPWGHWFTFSSFGWGFAASLMDRDCPASLVPYCNLKQTQPCSDTDHISPQQTHRKSSLALLLHVS